MPGPVRNKPKRLVRATPYDKKKPVAAKKEVAPAPSSSNWIFGTLKKAVVSAIGFFTSRTLAQKNEEQQEEEEHNHVEVSDESGDDQQERENDNPMMAVATAPHSSQVFFFF
jgi:hypothetical protein